MTQARGTAFLGGLGVVAAVGLGPIACAPASDDATTDDSAEVKSLKGVTKEERTAYLRKAQIWLGETNLTPVEIYDGPPGKGAFAMNAKVTCDFVEPTKPAELGGKSKKFACKLPDGREIKVKYGSDADDNGEIYGEVIATRTLWALGFPADRMYPVRITCNGCPEEPWKAYDEFEEGKQKGGPRATRKFDSAVIEEKFEGAKIEVEGQGEGWSWGEIEDDHANARAGGAPAGHVNGLKLLAAFMKHADNKADNQRLVCLKDGVTDEGKCDKPVLMIQDTGVTFGGAATLFGLFYNDKARARFAEWSELPVWRDRGDCEAELRDARTGTMTHPQILEAGRQFLAERLMTLTDPQIRAIFLASRVEERGEEIEDITANAPSPRRKVTVDDWRIAFKVKRDDIVKHTCTR